MAPSTSLWNPSRFFGLDRESVNSLPRCIGWIDPQKPTCSKPISAKTRKEADMMLDKLGRMNVFLLRPEVLYSKLFDIATRSLCRADHQNLDSQVADGFKSDLARFRRELRLYNPDIMIRVLAMVTVHNSQQPTTVIAESLISTDTAFASTASPTSTSGTVRRAKFTPYPIRTHPGILRSMPAKHISSFAVNSTAHTGWPPVSRGYPTGTLAQAPSSISIRGSSSVRPASPSALPSSALPNRSTFTNSRPISNIEVTLPLNAIVPPTGNPFSPLNDPGIQLTTPIIQSTTILSPTSTVHSDSETVCSEDDCGDPLFCQLCRNRWIRHEHEGVQCPICTSEYVENLSYPISPVDTLMTDV